MDGGSLCNYVRNTGQRQSYLGWLYNGETDNDNSSSEIISKCYPSQECDLSRYAIGNKSETDIEGKHSTYCVFALSQSISIQFNLINQFHWIVLTCNCISQQCHYTVTGYTVIALKLKLGNTIQPLATQISVQYSNKTVYFQVTVRYRSQAVLVSVSSLFGHFQNSGIF